MTIHSNRTLRHGLETIFRSGTLAGLTDDQLLVRFAGREGDAQDEDEAEDEAEAAFAVLVERHGPMVLSVCRGVLGDPHEADDAFQATFLVLMRQAGTIRKRQSVGPWLHGVAHRVACCARAKSARRRAHERRWSERQGNAISAPHDVDLDLPATIHAELARLPGRYREPIVLCDLEDRSLDEAARQLGWPLGTVKSRLNRGRQRLRDRLVRRGVAPGVAGLALSGAALTRSVDAAATVSPALAEATAKLIAGAGGMPAEVLALVQRFGRMMLMGKLGLAAVGAIVLGLSTIGITTMAGGPPSGAGQDATPARVVTARSGSPKAAADKGQATVTKRKPRPRPFDGSRREIITVGGRATDSSGQPVAGATVYIIDSNRQMGTGARSRLATTLTGPDGRFIARDVELPVWKPLPSPLPTAEEGRFQVAGTAAGFGFTWHPVVSFRPADRPAAPSARTDPAAGKAEAFYRGEPISVDLSFGPPATIRGKLVDDVGRPVAGAKVQVGVIDLSRGTWPMWSCRRVAPTDAIPEERREFNGIHALPAELLTTRSGPDGSYRIDGLPREAQLLCRIDPGPEYDPLDETIATSDAAIQGVRSLGHEGVRDHTFEAPREVRFTVRYLDTHQPARGTTVRAMSDRTMLRAGGVGVTDQEGRTSLHLRPGEYTLAIEPALGNHDLPSRLSVQVGREENGPSIGLELEQGVVVTMEARDAKTGASIEGVRFQYETDANSRRQELHSQPIMADHPQTDEQGRLRTVVEPGRRRFFVARVPAGWKHDGKRGTPVILVAGREQTIRWEFTRVDEPKADEGSGPALFPDDLVETWRGQDRRALPGKFRIRHYSYFVGRDGISPDELEAFLDANDLSKSPDPAAALEDRFPALPEGSPTSCEIIDDGRHLRNTYHDLAKPGPTSIVVSNGIEVVTYGGVNGQSDIFGPKSGVTHAIFGLRDICARPWVLTRGQGRAIGKVRREESGGRLTVEEETENSRARWVVDRRTGFVHADSLRSKRQGVVDQIVRQYGPKTFPGGVVLPSVIVRIKMHSIVLDIIDEVDLAYRPTPLDFAVGAAAGTVIVDNREDSSHPTVGVNHYPVADVIAYADGRSRHRSIEPLLKVGQPAPAIEPATWFDREGTIDPPDVAGKVVVVDFWGIDCGFCVVELPEVQAAVDHFADRSKDLVFIGLHESGATHDQVAEFARKRGLTYRLAIDRPAVEDGWFGATFQEYGVRGIPAVAVIDRKGNVAFIGRSFPEALNEAARLLGP